MRKPLILAGVVSAALLAVAASPVWADPGSTVSVSPSVVDVGLNFAGGGVQVSGTAPEGADVVVKVDGPTTSVKVSKKGKVLGLFWMTVDRAEVENMPAYHLVRSSNDLDKILDRNEQVRLGLDPMSASIMTQAQAVNASNGSALPAAKAAEFIAGLRDEYIQDGRYTPCVRCHSTRPADNTQDMVVADHGDSAVHLENGQWDTRLSLPWDTPLGEYTVTCYCVKDGQMLASDSTTFTVKKAGLVNSLGSFAQRNGAAYGVLALGIIIAAGMTIGFVFPKSRSGH